MIPECLASVCERQLKWCQGHGGILKVQRVLSVGRREGYDWPGQTRWKDE